jgi:hypothetical protein
MKLVLPSRSCVAWTIVLGVSPILDPPGLAAVARLQLADRQEHDAIRDPAVDELDVANGGACPDLARDLPHTMLLLRSISAPT